MTIRDRFDHRRGGSRSSPKKEKGSGENPKPFVFGTFARILQVNGRLSAFFSFALSNGKHFFGGLGQSPKD